MSTLEKPKRDHETIQAAEYEWIDRRRTTAKVAGRNDPKKDAFGLGLSGGGVRSATFNLGLLQALQRGGILKEVDYLSTVSGGGYIGASLTWFMDRLEGFFPFGTSREDHNRQGGAILSWLRDHGCYLTPGDGLNLWALIAATLGAVLFNLIVIFPVLLLVFFLARECYGYVIALVAGGLLLLYYLWMVLSIPSIRGYTRTLHEKRERMGKVLLWGLLLCLFGALPEVYCFIKGHLASWISGISLSGLASFAGAFRGINGTNETRGVRSALLSVGLTLMVYGVMLLCYHIVAKTWFPWYFLVPFLLLSIVLAWRANINHVSMHRYYRNRLLEAYMPWEIIGESRERADGFFLKDIDIGKSGAPYPIINTTINLVGSDDTRFRERGGDNFIFSPCYCGSDATDYIATEAYLGGRVNLATAFSVSGAAVDPNTYVTRSKPITFFMTLFNARLGYWTNSPSHPQGSSTPFGFTYYYYMFREMLGRGLNEHETNIHLSDGGHFENLGLYELIRRRCRYIIVSDAGNDPGLTFGDLARVIELCRVDFGADIDLDTRLLRPRGESRISEQGFIRGTVTYADGSTGDLIYVNTVMIADLPEDLYGYRRTNGDFPDQTTSDQFFDEAQFEAYRELGFRIGMTICPHGGITHAGELFH